MAYSNLEGANTPGHIRRNIALTKGFADIWLTVINGIERHGVPKDQWYSKLKKNNWDQRAAMDALREALILTPERWVAVESLLMQLPEGLVSDGAPRPSRVPLKSPSGEPEKRWTCFMCDGAFERMNLSVYIEPMHRRKVLLCRSCRQQIIGDDRRPTPHGIVLPAQGQTRIPGSHRSGRHT